MTFFRDEYHRRLEGDWTDIRFHLPYLHETTLSYKEPAVLELGVRTANSTVTFLSAMEEAGGRLVSCDISDPEVDGKLMTRLLDSGRWEFARCDSLDLGTSGIAFDVIFIDTDHALYQTYAELRKFWSWLKPGGKMLLHDTEWGHIGIYESLHMHGKDDSYGPVAWALDEFCRAAGITWTNHPGSYGLGEICR